MKKITATIFLMVFVLNFGLTSVVSNLFCIQPTHTISFSKKCDGKCLLKKHLSKEHKKEKGGRKLQKRFIRTTLFISDKNDYSVLEIKNNHLFDIEYFERSYSSIMGTLFKPPILFTV